MGGALIRSPHLKKFFPLIASSVPTQFLIFLIRASLVRLLIRVERLMLKLQK